MRSYACLSLLSLLATYSLSASAGTPQQEQIRIMPIDNLSGTEPFASVKPMLADMLTLENSLSIFYSYARETEMSKLLTDEKSRITVLAPTNKAVMALARKPHQGPKPVEDGTIITEEEFDSRSKENVEKWIGAHIIPQYPIRLSPTSQFETMLRGCVVTVSAKGEHAFDNPDDGTPEWSKIVLNGNISVTKHVETANGDLYLIDGAIYG